MPAPTSTHDFLDLVRKSDLIDAERMDAFEQSLAASGADLERPQALAQQMVREGLLTIFQAKQLLIGKSRGFVISGKYRLLELLGTGGMGAVYLCEHIFMRRLVALKVLPVDKLQDAGAIERFYREARAAGALDHPNIVRAYDIDQDDKLHFLVMEFVDGASLQEIVARRGPVDPTRAAHYIRQSAQGLQHAHEAGLVHRDIKPGNLLLDRAGTIKILDLGLARFFNAHKDNVTEKYDEGSVLGTADYLAPEQAMNNKVDIRSDLYSLGATFYFLLSGKAPFQEGTITQKLLWHQTKSPPNLRELRPGTPGELIAIVERLMAKSPADRYQTPVQLAEALAPWTRTPIAPPSVDEMPRLSPAVTNRAGRDSAPVLPSATPRTAPVPAARPPAPASQRRPADGARPSARETRPLDGRTIEEPRPATAPRRRAPAQRPNRTIWYVAGGGGAALIAMAGIMIWALNRPTPDKTGGQTGSVRATNTRPPMTGPETGDSNPTTLEKSEDLPLIRPDDAKQYLRKRVRLEMEVKYVGRTQNASRYFFNSMDDYRNAANFTVTFGKRVIDQLATQGVTDLKGHYERKTIRVVGTVTEFENRLQIEITDARQLQLVGLPQP